VNAERNIRLIMEAIVMSLFIRISVLNDDIEAPYVGSSPYSTFYPAVATSLWYEIVANA
jgi:hypothetical protein